MDMTFPRKLCLHHSLFSCYLCLLGLDVFNGLDYGHFVENSYIHHSLVCSMLWVGL